DASPNMMPRTPSDPYLLTNDSRTTPVQPAPYLPCAKMPTESKPHRPLTPWIEIAPTGSSTPAASKKNTVITTKTPAKPPITAAAQESTKAQGAVMATRPASMPLHIIDGSGFIPLAYIMNNIDVNAPATPASIVLTVTVLMRRSVPAKVDPGLNPNQPK